jgi:hypothetical protein
MLSSSIAALEANKTESRTKLIIFDFTLWDLEQAACDGCSFCKWILDANDKQIRCDSLVRKLANLEDHVTRNEFYDTLQGYDSDVDDSDDSDDSDEGTPHRAATTTP